MINSPDLPNRNFRSNKEYFDNTQIIIALQVTKQ
jgi:hypothetical protein